MGIWLWIWRRTSISYVMCQTYTLPGNDEEHELKKRWGRSLACRFWWWTSKPAYKHHCSSYAERVENSNLTAIPAQFEPPSSVAPEPMIKKSAFNEFYSWMAGSHVSRESAGSTWNWQGFRVWRRFPSKNGGEHAGGEGGSKQQSETENKLGEITHSATVHLESQKSHDGVPPKSGAQAGRAPRCLEPPDRDDHYIRTQRWWGSLSRSWEISFGGPGRPVSNHWPSTHLLRELDHRVFFDWSDILSIGNINFESDRFLWEKKTKKQNLITLLITISSEEDCGLLQLGGSS